MASYDDMALEATQIAGVDCPNRRGDGARTVTVVVAQVVKLLIFVIFNNYRARCSVISFL